MFSQTDPPAVRSSAAPLLESLVAEPEIGARRMTLGLGEQIHSHEAAAENIYLIHRGQVRLYQITDNDSARLLEILGRGEWFGVAALAGAERYGSRSVAVVPSVISEVPIDRLREVLHRRPDVLAELNSDLARRLLVARDDASRLTFDDCNQRLITTLIRFSQSAASTPAKTALSFT